MGKSHDLATIAADGLEVDTIKNTSGTSALTIDSNGTVSQPVKPAFHIRYNTQSGINFSNTTAAGTAYYNSSTLEEQGGSNFNISTGQYVVPVTGFYFFNFTGRFDNVAASYFYVTLEGSQTIGRYLSSLQTTYLAVTVSGAAHLTAGEHIKVVITSSGDTSVDINADSYFQGFLLG